MYKTWKWVGIGQALRKLVKCLLKDNELEAEYNKILGKVSNSTDKGFDSKPVYFEIYLKIEIKSDERKIKASFYDNGMFEEGSGSTFSSMLLITLVVKMDKSCYLQVFSTGYIYIVMEKRVVNILIIT